MSETGLTAGDDRRGVSETGLVDLVLPVYNEAHVLEQSVDRLAATMSATADFPWRILIADNGSTDGTTELANRLAEQLEYVRILHLSEKGRGRALRMAWTETDAKFSIYMDVDLSTDLAAVPKVVELLRGGSDLVTGSRLHGDASTTRCLKRDVLSRGYNRLIRWTLGTKTFDDAQCGFKGVRIAAIRKLLPLVKNQHWFFDTELLVLAEYAKMTVHSIPIQWEEDADSRVNIPATILQDLKGLARLRMTARSLTQAM